MEFIQKANAVELPRLSPEDLADTDQQKPLIVTEEPHGSEVHPTPPQSRAIASASAQDKSGASASATAQDKSGASASATAQDKSGASASASTQDTVVIHKRRKSAPIPKERFDELPIERRRWWHTGIIIGLVGLLALLIWFWSHSGESSDAYTEPEPQTSATAPMQPTASDRLAPVALPAVAAGTRASVEATAVAPIDSASVVDIDSTEPVDTAGATRRAKTPDAKPARTGHAASGSSAAGKAEAPAPKTLGDAPPAASATPSTTPIIGKMPWRDPD